MSATIQAPEADTRPAPRPLDAARRALLLADMDYVHRQNLFWLSRRFGFQQHVVERVAPRDDQPPLAYVEPLPYLDLPAWKRWLIVVRLAAAGDAEARWRVKVALGYRFLGRRPTPPALAPILALDSDAVDEDTYGAWIERYDHLSAADRTIIDETIAAGGLPDITILVRTPDPAHIPALTAGLAAQLLPNWRALFVVEPGLDIPSTDPRIAFVTAEDAAARVGAADSWLVVAEPGVTLRPETLFTFALAARANPGWRLVFADEDGLDAGGHRHAPIFKPDFSPELNRRMAYLGSCVALRADLFDGVPAPGQSVAAWASAQADRLDPASVGHVDRVLFHTDALTPQAPLLPLPKPHWREPSVAIVIPTRNHAALLRTCVESIRAKTAYPREKLHFVIIDNGSDQPDALDLLERLGSEPDVTLLRDPSPFNYARLNNVAARATQAEVLVFLNNDTEADDPAWLATIAGWAAEPGIGVVGPKLLYPDRTIQHAGVVLGIGGVAGHSFVGLPADSPGYIGLAGVTREAAALTGACIAIKRALFEEIGGFDEKLIIAFNDTALCCEALCRGNRNLYVGDVAVIHHESKSRGFDDTPEKLARFRTECMHVRTLYKGLFDRDPYYSADLGLERQFQPAIPRAPRPWRAERRRIDPHPRVLILSDVHAVGHGVPVVIKQHAEYLAAQGWTVFVGGPLRGNEITYEGCLRVYLDGPLEAQSVAYEADVDCVISHTIPYFQMFRTMSDHPRRVIYDHGEPPPDWFPDRQDRVNIDNEKQFIYRLVELVLTNTVTVKDEIGFDRAEAAGLGNSHLATWSPAHAAGRAAIRRRLGLEDKIVVLNVCRFHRAERQYKGVEDFVALKDALAAADPALAERVVFILCGKGSASDQREMEKAGLTVMANVTDAELIDLYVAADLYANFSKWEGFNLGIAQALAMGLEVVASAIPAHRQFPIEVADAPAERLDLVQQAIARHENGRHRQAVLMPWKPLLQWLEQRLETLCAVSD